MDKKTNHNKPRAVVLLLQGMGNSLLATPLIEMLSKTYLLDVITWRNGTDQLILRNPSIASIYFPKINTFNGLLKLIYKNKIFGYESSYEAFPPGKRSHLLSFLLAAKNKHGYKIGLPWDLLLNNAIDIKSKIHDVDQNLRLVGVNKPGEHIRPTIYLTDEELRIGKMTCSSGDGIGLHIGSGGRLSSKRWPVGHFAALLDMFHLNGNTELTLFGDTNEFGLMQECLNKCKHAKPVIIHSKPIRNIASCIKQCKLFISNDSGLMHVATAVGTPTIGIFGPTDQTRTAPYGSQNKVIRTKLICAPCYSFKGWINCNSKQSCMASIKPEEVFRAAKEIL